MVLTMLVLIARDQTLEKLKDESDEQWKEINELQPEESKVHRVFLLFPEAHASCPCRDRCARARARARRMPWKVPGKPSR